MAIHLRSWPAHLGASCSPARRAGEVILLSCCPRGPPAGGGRGGRGRPPGGAQAAGGRPPPTHTRVPRTPRPGGALAPRCPAGRTRGAPPTPCCVARDARCWPLWGGPSAGGRPPLRAARPCALDARQRVRKRAPSGGEEGSKGGGQFGLLSGTPLLLGTSVDAAVHTATPCSPRHTASTAPSLGRRRRIGGGRAGGGAVRASTATFLLGRGRRAAAPAAAPAARPPPAPPARKRNGG